ncbi:MAG: PQQ-binding-like beta-propeller repeat protein, partial [Candidatus Eremiobacteraeota bacterium]|nr:PQQ-binding-like beta-propeller repeat protein [Candidatus Eremiobacteraeota bacterium]
MVTLSQAAGRLLRDQARLPMVKKWATSTNRWGAQTAPIADQDKVFLCEDTGGVRAVRSQDGETVWSREKLISWSQPALAEQRLFVRDYGSLKSLDANNGQTVWEVPISDRGSGSPLVAKGRVFYTVPGQVAARRSDDGGELWQREFNQPALVGTTPSGQVVVYSDKKILGLDGQTGETDWSIRAPGKVAARLTPDGTLVVQRPTGGWLPVLVPEKNTLFGYDAETGAKLWNEDTPGLTFEVDGRGQILTADASGHLEQRVARTGERNWSADCKSAPEWLQATPEGTWLVGEKAELTALAADSGERLWQGRLESPTGQPASGPDGSLFARSEGEIFCLTRPVSHDEEVNANPITLREEDDVVFFDGLAVE